MKFHSSGQKWLCSLFLGAVLGTAAPEQALAQGRWGSIPAPPAPKTIPYSDFMKQGPTGAFHDVTLGNQRACGHRQDGEAFCADVPPNDNPVQYLKGTGTVINSAPAQQPPSNNFSWLMPFLILAPTLLGTLGVRALLKHRQKNAPGGPAQSGGAGPQAFSPDPVFMQSNTQVLAGGRYRGVIYDPRESAESSYEQAVAAGVDPEKARKYILRDYGVDMKDVIAEAKKSATTFKDVAGIDEAVYECRDIVNYLKDPAGFTRLGGKVPKGFLFTGPPGSGKTLLARAIAGEANVPFFFMAGSAFEEQFVGVGAKRMRDLFDKAKKQPCIVFIDEIDAIGKTRASAGGTDTHSQTLNQLLVELDGFEQHKDVILIAATNRPDILDPALTRPPRFSRKLGVPYPDEKGRRTVLDLYVKKIITDGAIDTAALAQAAWDFSPAMLENVVNEAAISATKAGKKGVEQIDLMKALQDEAMGGKELRFREVPPDQEERTAVHEGGHIELARLLGLRNILLATIVPRERSHGHVWSVPKTRNITKKFLEDDMLMLLAGRAAEDIYFNGDVGPGAGGDPKSDIGQVTARVRNMVKSWGMSELGPIDYMGDLQTTPFGQSVIAETTATKVDEIVAKMVNDAYARTKGILEEHKDELLRIVAALRERKTMTGDEIEAAVREEFKPAPVAAEIVIPPPLP